MRFHRTGLWRCVSGIKNKSQFMCQGQKLITKIAGTEAEDLCPNKSNQLYKQSWNEIAFTLHHPHVKGSVKKDPRRYPLANTGAD